MERNSRKERVGIVVSDKMDKTIVVAVVNKYKHPLYKKTVSTTKKYKAHDENNVMVLHPSNSNPGQMVLRPAPA